MAAAKGNTYAQKWTKETAIEFMQGALDTLIEDESIFSFVGLMVKMESYEDVYTYLKDKYGEKVFRPIKNRIDTILHARVLKKGYTSGGAAMSIFILKNKYGYQDNQNVNTNHSGDVNINASVTIIDGNNAKTE